jgi:tRNA (guanine37-N1)-methyltransferase
MYAHGKHRVTDDAPFGGGGGMVMKVEPIDRALAALELKAGEGPIILMSPQGEPFRQETAEELAACRRLVFICGHYEGVDERVREHLADREISIGDFVLTGGELSAMMIIDAVSRLVPGVLGNIESSRQDSFSAGLLEHPHYTRPQEYRGWQVPEVLLNGNHRDIDAWRRRQSLTRTWRRRPELLEKVNLTAADRMILREIQTEDR